ncbi:phage tail protein, partial [Enterovibrio sp. Hal110]
MSTFSGSRSARALQENVEKLTGQRGNGLDRAVTLRDLQTLGLASLTRSSNGAVLPKPVPQTETGDAAVQRPSAPTAFSGVGGFGAILLEWRLPSYNGHAHTEVWRHTEDVLSAATMIATTPATVFGDIVKPGASFYYWIRHINVNDIEGPYNAEAGTQVST